MALSALIGRFKAAACLDFGRGQRRREDGGCDAGLLRLDLVLCHVNVLTCDAGAAGEAEYGKENTFRLPHNHPDLPTSCHRFARKLIREQMPAPSSSIIPPSEGEGKMFSWTGFRCLPMGPAPAYMFTGQAVCRDQRAQRSTVETVIPARREHRRWADLAQIGRICSTSLTT